jgi:hypothetical protein
MALDLEFEGTERPRVYFSAEYVHSGECIAYASV